MSQFAIIHNPQRLVFKHEVWYKGKGIGQDAKGFAIEVDVCKRLGKFTTPERAQGYIQYKQDVRAFCGE